MTDTYLKYPEKRPNAPTMALNTCTMHPTSHPTKDAIRDDIEAIKEELFNMRDKLDVLITSLDDIQSDIEDV